MAEQRGHEAHSGDAYIYDAADRMIEYRTDVAAPVTALENALATSGPDTGSGDPTFDRRAFLATLGAGASTGYNFDSLGNRKDVTRSAGGTTTMIEDYDLLEADDEPALAAGGGTKPGGGSEYC